MIYDILKNFRLLITLFILPFICILIRKISPSYDSNRFKEFNDKSYFSASNSFILKNKSMENSLNIQDYNNTRIYFETKYNKIKLYITLSKENYYDGKRIQFSIYLNINNLSNITYINNSFTYSENYENKMEEIQFKQIKESLMNYKKKYLMKYISIKFDSNYTNVECKIFFEDFDFVFQLKREKYSYKIFYLLESLISLIFFFVIICVNIEEQDHNLQNISIIFLFIIRTKILISMFSRIISLFKVGIALFKIIKFYFHILIYGEFILTMSDIMMIVILILFLLCLGNYIQILKDNEGNYFYCFNNKIENNKIVPNKNKNINYIYIIFSIVFFGTEIIDKSGIIYFNFIPLYIGLISAIIKYLTQRDITYLKDKKFCIRFYSFGTIIYSYYLFINSLGEFYRIKFTFKIYPFIIVFLLYITLYYIIINEYKLTYVMKDDFAKLKKLDKECCSICLKDFCYNIKNESKLFCKVNQEHNIHKTICNHFFHEKCLFLWRKYGNLCPICKKGLNIPKYYYFYEYTPCIYKWEVK